MGTMECLSSLVGPAYESFCNKEFVSTVFVDIKGAFDSVHIPTLVSLHVPNSVCNFIHSLFPGRSLKFSFPSGTVLNR